MKTRRAFAAAAIALFLPLCSYADDVSKPDPLAVVDAAIAAQRAHNVDAILALWDDDGVWIGPIGKKITGRDNLRTLFINLVKEEASGNPDLSKAKIKGDTILLDVMVSAKYLVELGVAPIMLKNLNVVDGDKLKSRVFYYPPDSIAKIDEACKKQNILIFNRPCSDFIEEIRAHTNRLITEGVVDKND